ncbi:MAG TPA: hypothetical protein VH722_05775 [Alphaproteobacteria bacterium]|jgi:hypothetical protein|nr:hypothetical protein [Alphaproteobacteria bacterium]
MSLLLSALTRAASSVLLFAVILYAPGFVSALALPKWVWHARSRPAAVGCPRRLAEAQMRAVRYGVPKPASDGAAAAACLPAPPCRA